ncbi:MAG: aminodeoxychorismate lyase [Alphaproteobacteria bacterium]
MVSALVNGAASDRIDILDRGFQYGDGLFETVKLADGVLEFWSRHMARLLAGCVRLRIPAPDPALLRSEAQKLCAGTARGAIKIVVTRGAGGRGYRPPEPANPNRIVALFPAPEYPELFTENGVRVRFCQTRLSDQPLLAGLKHLNRLEQVLARGEWSDDGIQEGLMLDGEDSIIEGTMTNLFIARDGILRTPALSQSGVDGILRGVVMDLARYLGIKTNIRRISRDELDAADEIFLTNSIIGIWPVREIDGRACRVGPITGKLNAALAKSAKD